MKVRMYPHVSELGTQVGGIAEVVKAYFRFLPQFGVELVAPDSASYDLIAAHAGITGSQCDIAHTHGLYFSADYNADDWEYRVNARVIEACRNAKAITVPSAWVAETFQRDMRLNPYVIPHGIVWQEWQHKEQNQGYVLYTKTRNADVCDNSILDTLTARFPNVTFVSTLPTPILSRRHTSEWPANFKTIETGARTPHAEMKKFIQRAGVYLSVAKETFGIGILEAMASGVPVLGWNWGGNSFLIQHGVNGYLAQPGNIEDLCEGLNYCLKHQKVLGTNGRELAKSWTWEKACLEVSRVYKIALKEEEATVSVVIPVYNKPYDQVRRAVKSVLDQTYQPLEIVLVNDGSTPTTEQSIKFSEEFIQRDLKTDRITFVNQSNSGVAIARNNGISHTHSKYIACLDSDDWLEPTFLEVCIRELEKDRTLGITYTSLRAWNEDGSNLVSAWPGTFNADKQLTYPKQNQIPTCCVFRKDAWERVGGYKARYAPGGCGSEDAALWSAITSIGYNAKKVTEEALFNYTAFGGNVHANKEYLEVDWLSMYPWAKDKQHPFASVATPLNRVSHPVRQYDEPVISVIIPVGPGHEKEVANALDSLEMQTFRKWEVIVVFDTGNEYYPELFTSYPYIRPVFSSKKGAGFARNLGVKNARASLLFFLDADDVLSDSEALQKMLDAWNQQEAVIYSDYLGKAQWNLEDAQKEFGERLLGYNAKQGTAVFRQYAADFNPELAQRQPELNTATPNMPYYHWCLVSVLVPKLWHLEIGGFDESMETWEDVDYHWRLARTGHCFFRIPEPLVMYAYHKGTRREKSAVNDEVSLHRHKSMIQYITKKYEKLEIKMCNCGKRKPVVNGASVSMNDNDFVLIELHFPGDDTRSDYGKSLISPTGQVDSSGRKIDYHGYARRRGDKFLVHKEDQQARPDMFRLVTSSVVLETPKQELQEPVLLSEPDVEPKKRGRKAKV